MKKILVSIAVLTLLVFALTAESCGAPPTLHTKQTLLSGAVVATFVNPQTGDLSGRYLMLEFRQPGTYTETFALGPHEPKFPADGDKAFIPHQRTFTATTTITEDDIAQKDWPTYFTITITGPDGTSDSVEFYSN